MVNESFNQIHKREKNLGAPYFAAIAPMKIGADLSFVYAHPEAARVIKGYSPELIVYPSNDFETNRQSIKKLDSLVFGPGLGREEHICQLLKKVIEFAKETPEICVVIDADGLFYLKDCFNQLSGCHNLVITPNHREFARLFSHVFPQEETADLDKPDKTKQLAHRLGVCVVRKGEHDYISDGRELIVCKEETSKRRCGGQGDILSGAIALFSYWAKRREANDGTQRKKPTTNGGAYSAMQLMEGANAASQLVRRASLEAFMRIGRSMCAEDLLAAIPTVIREIDSLQSLNRMVI